MVKIYTNLFCVSVGQRILLEMWQSEVASPMHAIHMGFGVGAMVSPLISNRFLAVLHFYDDGDPELHNQTVNGTTPYTVDVGGKVERFSILKESRVEYAYITIGLLTITLSLPFFIYPIFRCFSAKIRAGYEDMEKAKPISCKMLVDILNPLTYTHGSKALGIFIATTSFLFFMNIVGSEQMFGNFIRTFSVDQLHFPRNQASYLDTVFWAGFTLGRLTGSILSHWIPIKTLVMMDVTLHLISVTLLDIFSANTKTALWIFTALTGFLISPLYPVFISFLNTQIEVSGVVITFVTFATGIGQFTYIWLAGALYENYGPRTILYGMQGSAILLFLIALVAVLRARRSADQTKNDYAELEEPTEEMALHDPK